MVKKITGTGSIKPAAAKEVDPIKAAEIREVNRVGAVAGTAGAGRVRQATRPMTAEERAKLLAMVDEETEKLFASGTLPRERKETLARAVKITLESLPTD